MAGILCLVKEVYKWSISETSPACKSADLHRARKRSELFRFPSRSPARALTGLTRSDRLQTFPRRPDQITQRDRAVGRHDGRTMRYDAPGK